MTEAKNRMTATLDPTSEKKAWVRAVTSGKGGVGKTSSPPTWPPASPSWATVCWCSTPISASPTWTWC